MTWRLLAPSKSTWSGINGLSNLKDYIPVMIKMPNQNQNLSASFKAPNHDLKDMEVLCAFKINLESQKLDEGSVKAQGLYPDHDQDSKSQSGISSVLKSPKSGLIGHGGSLHCQNQLKVPKFYWGSIKVQGL